jgi:hypothetical protein
LRSPVPSQPRPGQVLIILALAFTAMLGAIGVAVDLGFGYAHHVQVQNAADAAALAGAQALGRHYNYAAGGPALASLGLSDYTDSAILSAMTSAAAASVPPFPDPATAPNWPSGTGNSLAAYYLLTDDDGTITQGATVGSGSIPAAAAGVRVEARLQSATIFARVLGACCANVNVFESARALLRPLGYTDAGPPFIVCGGGPFANGDGAWIVSSPIPSHIGPSRQILDFSTSPVQIDTEYVGDTLHVHSPQLGQNGADCGAGNSYKGNEDPSDTCNPAGAGPLPCYQEGKTGTRAGPVRNRVGGLPGCAPDASTITGCVVILDVADSYQSGVNQFRVVTYAPFLITQTDSNEHDGQLLGATMVDGTPGSGPFRPGAPGAFTIALVPDR